VEGFKIQNPKPKIAIVGAGPAGASLAIRLAQRDFQVYLIEREKFPRHKLCGEFISPECLAHFSELGVLDSMLASGGERIRETVFYAPDGRNVAVPSEWFGNRQGALSLSRAEMDFHLIERAKKAGAEIYEETQAIKLLYENENVGGVKVRFKNGETREIPTNLTIDATGRANVLGKLAAKSKIQSPKSKTPKNEIRNPKSKIQNRIVGFKTHLENVNLEKNRCEIYFFRGGYGGLSCVENNLANHCFLIKGDVVKEFGGNADEIVEKVIFKNKRAAETLKNAAPVLDWLAVSVDGFGVKNLTPAKNLFAVGDSAAFIDPFTGSGMLMALESAEILAQCITKNSLSVEHIAENYRILYHDRFHRRLRLCSLLRRAAFVPNVSWFIISALGYSEKARAFLARSTRQSPAVNKNK
jgi:flavin-dependent dehydrogenase